jgi:hypothetical protein
MPGRVSPTLRVTAIIAVWQRFTDPNRENRPVLSYDFQSWAILSVIIELAAFPRFRLSPFLIG